MRTEVGPDSTLIVSGTDCCQHHPALRKGLGGRIADALSPTSRTASSIAPAGQLVAYVPPYKLLDQHFPLYLPGASLLRSHLSTPLGL